jgi:hypothetical protein
VRQVSPILLPQPPAPTGNPITDIQNMNQHMVLVTTLLNQTIQNTQNRLNTIQQTGAKAPPNVSGLAVTGQQGLFHLTWNRIQNADGYVILQSSSSSMSPITGRYTIADGGQCSHQIPVGNVAVTSHFQVYSYQGPQVGLPSPVVSGTTKVFNTSTGDNAPPNPPLAPLAPIVQPVRSGPNLS